MFLDGGDGNDQIFSNAAGSATLIGGEGNDRLFVAGGSGNVVDAGAGDDDIADFGESTIYSGAGNDFYSLSADQTNQVSTLPDIDFEEDFLVILLDQAEIDTNPSVRTDISYKLDSTGEFSTLSYTYSDGFVEVVARIPISLAWA